MAKPKFDCSRELKSLFNQEFERWSRRNRAGLHELAALCGVTPAYLSHIGRYGRVPSRSVMILLAFCFKIENPQRLFDVAGIREQWPYEAGTRLTTSPESDPGFLSIKLDMAGFADQIRSIVRAEIRPKSVHELTRGKPIRVGFNRAQTFLFEDGRNATEHAGFYPELFRQLSISLQQRIEVHQVDYREAFDALGRGELDMFGPIYSTPQRIGKAIYSEPFLHAGVAALARRQIIPPLMTLPMPKSLDDIREAEYVVAVLEDTAMQHFAESHLSGSRASIQVCSTPAECLERLTMSVARPAHLMLCDAAIAAPIADRYPVGVLPLFLDPQSWLGELEDTIAIRPDWADLLEVVNEALRFMVHEGLLQDIWERSVRKELRRYARIAADPEPFTRAANQ